MPGTDDYDYDYDFNQLRETRRDKKIKQLERTLKHYNDKVATEEKLRKKCPALQDAWEAYQIVLRTVS